MSAATVLLILLVTACSVLVPVSTVTQVEATPTHITLEPTATSAPQPTATAVPPTPLPLEPSATEQTQPTETPTPSGSARPDSYAVRLHPDHALYAGDLVSLEVIGVESDDLDGQQVQVELPDGTLLEAASFEPYGIGRREQVTLIWIWDTSGLQPGDYTFAFKLLPEGESWTETVSLLPQNELSYPEPGARWQTITSECCVVNYVTGTAAERDIDDLLQSAEEQSRRIEKLFATDQEEQLLLTFLPRVMGHGGFAGHEVSISYLDRNYAGGEVDFVLGHEFIHKLDEQLGGEMLPSLLVEGLAVYLNGGHFKPEPLLMRAAVLLPPVDGCVEADVLIVSAGEMDNSIPCGLDWYVPLEELSDDFYLSQHEVGYLQAGALVEYMIERWGWDAYQEFYRHIKPGEGGAETQNGQRSSQADAIDDALMTYFGLSLANLDAEFIAALGREELTPAWVLDVRMTVEFYDSVRRYQQYLDTSAYFLTAWLVDGEQMRERGIVADFLRHPSYPANIALETMLVSAEDSLHAGDYHRTEVLLQAVNAVLGSLAGGGSVSFSAHPLAADYYAVVQALLAAGYQPQRIQIEGDQGQAWVTRSTVDLIEIRLLKSGGSWKTLLDAQ